MTLQNQCLTIPPAHPLASELNDLLGLQWIIMDQMNTAAARFNDSHDLAEYDRNEQALAIVGEEINKLRIAYRTERGGDETCTVGLTYDARGAPVVQRTGVPILTVV